MRVMKRGNIVPRVGVEPTSLAFRASVQPFRQVGSLVSPLYPRLPVYAAAHSEVSADYYTQPHGIVSLSMLTITFIQAMALHIQTQARFNNHRVHSLYRITDMETKRPHTWRHDEAFRPLFKTHNRHNDQCHSLHSSHHHSTYTFLHPPTPL